MLKQIKATQTEGYQQRLWFSDQQHDLFIWLDNKDQPVAFQFCSNKLHDVHVILWDQHRGYSQHKIDSG